MSVYKEVDITITGQVAGDWNDNEYDVLLAEIKLIAAKHGLEVKD